MTADTMPATGTTQLVDAALGYAARGWPVLACRPGGKEPAGDLVPHGVLDATTDPAQIRAWWQQRPDANIGVACGQPGPDVLDNDEAAQRVLAELAAAGLLDRCKRIVRTPSGGAHVYYAGTSQRNGTMRGRRIDFRGQGGYVIAPPSIVAGVRYEVVAEPGGDGEIDWHAARAILDPPPPPPPYQPAREHRGAGDGGLMPGQDYAARVSWPEILEPAGWRKTRDLGNGRALWTRPGKQAGTSATTREDGGLYVFSSSTEFDVEVPYSKFGAMAVLDHGGDHSAAARALRLRGFGGPDGIVSPAVTVDDLLPVAEVAGQGAAVPAAGGSWDPVDLTAAVRGIRKTPPVLLARNDGRKLLYAGKTHTIAGESESLKTWLALLACAESINAGRDVLFIDYEDSPDDVVGRLLALGVVAEAILRHFRYVQPDESYSPAAAARLADTVPDPALAIIDGVTEAMAAHSLNPNDNADVAKFNAILPKPLAKAGAAVAMIDHVTKSSDSRGRYAIGAQHKLSGVTGAAYTVDNVKPFGHGRHGISRITVAKDRPGRVREYADAGKTVGSLHLESQPDGSVIASIRLPAKQDSDAAAVWRPTVIMEQVSRVIEQRPGLGSGEVIAAARGKRTDDKKLALGLLIAEGYVTVEQVGRSRLHRSARPFRDTSENSGGKP